MEGTSSAVVKCTTCRCLFACSPDLSTVCARRHGSPAADHDAAYADARQQVEEWLQDAGAPGRARCPANARIHTRAVDWLHFARYADSNTCGTSGMPHVKCMGLQCSRSWLQTRSACAGRFRTAARRVPGSGCVAPADIDAAFSKLIADTLRTMALDEGVRADGRGVSDLRSVFCEVPMSNECLAAAHRSQCTRTTPVVRQASCCLCGLDQWSTSVLPCSIQ